MGYQSAGTDQLLYQNNYLHVFPFWPNYRRDFTEYWEWQTDILTAYDGSEQRRGLRTYPRRSFEYELFANHFDSAAVQSFIWAGQPKLFAVPVWNAGICLSKDAEVIYESYFDYSHLPIKDANFYKGGYALGFMSPLNHELKQISWVRTEVGDAWIEVIGSSIWHAGTMVYPALPCRLAQQQTLDIVTSAFVTGVVSFNCLTIPYNLYGGAGFPTYKNYPVLEISFDKGELGKFEANYKTQLLDNKISNPYLEIESYTPSVVQTLKWFLTADKIEQFLRFIHDCQGRLHPFWLPSGFKDIHPVHLESGNLLTVTDLGYTQMDSITSGRNHLRIETVEGSVIYCKIIQSVKSTAFREILKLDTVLTITLAQIHLVSFLSLVRFDSDRIEIAYKHPAFALSTTSVRTLKHDL